MLRDPELDDEDPYVADGHRNAHCHCILSKFVLFGFGNLDPDLDGHTRPISTGFFHARPRPRAMLRKPEFRDEASSVADQEPRC
jgi:hypothetical protein